MFRSWSAASVTRKTNVCREFVPRIRWGVTASRRMNRVQSLGRRCAGSHSSLLSAHQQGHSYLAFLSLPFVESAIRFSDTQSLKATKPFPAGTDSAAKSTPAGLIGAALAALFAASSRVDCDEGLHNASENARSSSTNSVPIEGDEKAAHESRDGDEDDRVAADHVAEDDPPRTPPAGGSNGTADEKGRLFHGQCLQRQLHRPSVPYPAWDYNWDRRMTPATTLESLRTVQGLVNSRSTGTVRHVLLVRHGQYDEDPSDDKDRGLTPLGRVQAHRTGLRLMQLAQGNVGSLGLIGDSPCHFTKLHVSDMRRAKETAHIIASYLSLVAPSMRVMDPDPMLNEALPSPMIPVRPDIPNAEEEIDANHDRIEAAFAKYVHRAAEQQLKSSHPVDENEEGPVGDRERDDAGVDEASDAAEKEKADVGLRHEFEVIVGHGNVIRYFVCRGLQIPPEAWLRLSVFNCSLTYLVISPSGYVSVRALGDTGHLSYEETTFSGSHGYNW